MHFSILRDGARQPADQASFARMALNGSDSDEELLAAILALDNGGPVAAAAPEPPQSLQVVADGNFGGAASCIPNTMELPAVHANAGVDMDTSTTSSDSSGSSSFALELPLFADVAEPGEAAGTKRRRLTAKARDPLAGDDEPPAAQPDPNEQSDEHAWGRASSRSKSVERQVDAREAYVHWEPVAAYELVREIPNERQQEVPPDWAMAS